jgi:hypothetical protein
VAKFRKEQIKMKEGKRICILVQNNLVERLTAPVAYWARERGLTLMDVSSSANLDLDKCEIDWSNFDCVIPYGSTQFLQKVAQSTVKENLGYAIDAFAAKTWSKKVGSDLLNAEGFEMTCADFVRLLEANNKMYHARPADGTKKFNGGVFDANAWKKLVDERKISEVQVCYVSKQQKIKSEWRVWIVNNEVVETSQYREDDSMMVARVSNETVFIAAEKVIEKWLPGKSVVVDFALLEDGSCKVIEFNPIFSSGWYAADHRKILDALLETCADL